MGKVASHCCRSRSRTDITFCHFNHPATQTLIEQFINFSSHTHPVNIVKPWFLQLEWDECTPAEVSRRRGSSRPLVWHLTSFINNACRGPLLTSPSNCEWLELPEFTYMNIYSNKAHIWLQCSRMWAHSHRFEANGSLSSPKPRFPMNWTHCILYILYLSLYIRCRLAPGVCCGAHLSPLSVTHALCVENANCEKAELK